MVQTEYIDLALDDHVLIKYPLLHADVLDT